MLKYMCVGEFCRLRILYRSVHIFIFTYIISVEKIWFLVVVLFVCVRVNRKNRVYDYEALCVCVCWRQYYLKKIIEYFCVTQPFPNRFHMYMWCISKIDVSFNSPLNQYHNIHFYRHIATHQTIEKFHEACFFYVFEFALSEISLCRFYSSLCFFFYQFIDRLLHICFRFSRVVLHRW